VVGTRELLHHRQQGGVLVAGPGGISSPPSPVGEVMPGGQGVPMLWAGHLLTYLQQRGVPVAGSARISRLRGRASLLFREPQLSVSGTLAV
jgi:hypothetical protein